MNKIEFANKVVGYINEITGRKFYPQAKRNMFYTDKIYDNITKDCDLVEEILINIWNDKYFGINEDGFTAYNILGRFGDWYNYCNKRYNWDMKTTVCLVTMVDYAGKHFAMHGKGEIK